MKTITKNRINAQYSLYAVLLAGALAFSTTTTAQDGSLPDSPDPSMSATANDHGIVGAEQGSGQVEQAIATKNMLQILRDGGLMMLPIVFCSVVLMIFIFERTVSLRRGRVIPGPFVKRFILQLQEGQLKPDEALDLCIENHSPIAEVFAAAVKKWNRPCVEVEQAVLDAGERVANGLRKYLRIFNGISTICPLLGLLGTVVGMIQAFNAIATSDAMGRPEMLADGISKALLTTAAGMTVAIPAIIFYLYFVSRVDRHIIDIDAAGQEVVNAIASDGWKEKPKSKPARTATKSKPAASRKKAA